MSTRQAILGQLFFGRDPLKDFPAGRFYHKFAANICNEGLQDFVVPLPLDSINGFQLLKTKGIRPDVLHIDAGHDYLSVMADLKAWWPQLNPGGVLIGDDYFKKPIVGAGKWPEVRQAFDEFFAANPHRGFESGDGKVGSRVCGASLRAAPRPG
jgi:hypothetical protein